MNKIFPIETSGKLGNFHEQGSKAKKTVILKVSIKRHIKIRKACEMY
jgi:hypothetical protein